MVVWKLENGLLNLLIDNTSYPVTGNTILDIEDGKEVKIADNIIPKVSSVFPNIDFSLSNFFSTIRANISIPKEKNDILPECQFYVKDPDFISHNVPFLITDYYVADDVFLLIDPNQANELKKMFLSFSSGPIGYKQVALILKENSPYISIKENEIIWGKKCLSDLVKSNTRQILFPYQVSGVDWMDTVLSEDVGFVLADEMGLGKTVQIITVIDEQKNNGPSLLIAPNSLLENWSREINKFAPWISFYVDAGKNRQHNFRRLEKFDLVITSYDIARTDFAVFSSIDWNLIVLDEAQMIKNYGTFRSKEIRKFPKRCGIAVTGTPLENHLTDLWSIYDFCFPSLLGTIRDFKSTYSDNFDDAQQLEGVISSLMLRRHVKDVRKDLPEKVIYPIALEMNLNEAEDYERIKNANIDELGFSLGVINTMRSYCAMPSLQDSSLENVSPFEQSSKFNYLFESILDEVCTIKEKVIIFTSSIGAQQIICENVKSRYGAFCASLNGAVPQDKRQSIIDEFSNHIGFAVLLINPVVGATGLNITAANHVVFYTLEWNPASEDQCIARAARIGQTQTVFVYRLFYSGTVEDEVNDCLEKKRGLQSAAVKGTSSEIRPDIQNALRRSPFFRGDNLIQ